MATEHRAIRTVLGVSMTLAIWPIVETAYAAWRATEWWAEEWMALVEKVDPWTGPHRPVVDETLTPPEDAF